jgi:hypothetical protein
MEVLEVPPSFVVVATTGIGCYESPAVALVC